jgi:hypothetical protein
MFHKYERFENTNGLSEAVNTSRHWWNLGFIEWGPLTSGGFRGGVRGVRGVRPPKIRKAYVIQR